MINNTDTDKLFNQAVDYFQASDFSRAKNLISEILHINNNHFAAWLMHARLNIKNENIAMEAYREVLRLKPDFEEAIITLVNCHALKEEYDECEAVLRSAITTSPNYARYPFLLGKLLLQKGYHFEAAKYLGLAVMKEPENIQIKIALAETYGKHGNLDSSLEVLRPLLEENQPNFQAVMVFGNICTALNMVEDCLVLLNKISHIPLKPDQNRQLREIKEMLLSSGI